MLFPSSRNSGPCDRGSGDALTALGFSSVTRLLYRERQHREGQGRRDLESGRKSERKRKKKAAAGKKPAAAPIRQTSLRSSGLRTQDSGAQDLINLIGICVSYKWYAGDLGSFPTQAGKIASVQVIQSELARAGHELLQALRQSGHVAIDPHRPIRNLTQVFIILPQMQVVIENLRPRLPVLCRMLGEVSVVHPLTYGAANHSSGQRRPSHAYHLHIGSAHSEGLEHMILTRQGTGMSPWRMMNEWGIPTFHLESLAYQYASRLAERREYVPPMAVAGALSLEDHMFKALAMGAPYVKMVGMARAALTAAMVGRTIGERVDHANLPKHAAKHGKTRAEVFNHYLHLREDYEDLGEVPDGAVGVYSYMTRLAQGLKQLMTGSRKFTLDHLDRGDLACLTREAAEISGIPFVTDADADEVDEILSS